MGIHVPLTFFSLINLILSFFFFFLNDPAPPEISPLPLPAPFPTPATPPLFPLPRWVPPPKPLPAGINVQPLAKTSPESWGETDRQALEQGTAKPDPQDPKGPLPVAAVVTKDKARIVVYGTSNLATNQFLNVQGNRDFFLNTVSWLAEEEDQITVRPKDAKQTPIFLSAQQGRVVAVLPLVVLPGLVLAGGIVALIRRRAAN